MYCVVTPWPPQRNGIADYAFELARHAREPLLVATQALGPLGCRDDVVVLDEVAFSRSAVRSALPTLYHFGNNPDHAFMVPLFLESPGIAVVHEVSLHYLVQKVDALLPGFFEAQLRAEHPGIACDLQRLWRFEGMKRAMDFREIPLLGWLGAARALIVHSRYAARSLRAYLPRQRVHVVPHFAYPANASLAQLRVLRAQARARLRIAPDTLVVSTLGFVTRNKQYRAVFQALARAQRTTRRQVRMLIAGEVRAHEYDVEADLRELGAQGFTTLLGYVSEPAMREVLLASDLVVNLRFPTYGENSGSLSRALGLGCCVMVTQAGSYDELPDELCLKIPAKPDPSREIHTAIDRLLQEPARLHGRQAAAYEYAHTTLAPERAAARYSEIAHAA
jgi:glycosyltransferase involved in cell wall biosynthesis